jgi:hypothetical protein
VLCVHTRREPPSRPRARDDGGKRAACCASRGAWSKRTLRTAALWAPTQSYDRVGTPRYRVAPADSALAQGVGTGRDAAGYTAPF